MAFRQLPLLVGTSAWNVSSAALGTGYVVGNFAQHSAVQAMVAAGDHTAIMLENGFGSRDAVRITDSFDLGAGDYALFGTRKQYSTSGPGGTAAFNASSMFRYFLPLEEIAAFIGGGGGPGGGTGVQTLVGINGAVVTNDGEGNYTVSVTGTGGGVQAVLAGQGITVSDNGSGTITVNSDVASISGSGTAVVTVDEAGNYNVEVPAFVPGEDGGTVDSIIGAGVVQVTQLSPGNFQISVPEPVFNDSNQITVVGDWLNGYELYIVNSPRGCCQPEEGGY